MWRLLAGLICVLIAAGCGRVGYGLELRASDGGTDPPRPADVGAPDAGSADASSTDSGNGTDAGDGEFCDEDPCRLVLPQCGCPPDRMCTRPIEGSEARGCQPVGTRAVGETCAGNTDFPIGAGCIEAVRASICSPWCVDDTACPTDSTCVGFSVAADTVGACMTVYDPFTHSGCPDGLSCYLALGMQFPSRDLIGISTCDVAGTTPVGSPCSSPVECVAGAICAEVCHQTCRIGTLCGAMDCRPTSPPFRIAGIEYGYCP